MLNNKNQTTWKRQKTRNLVDRSRDCNDSIEERRRRTECKKAGCSNECRELKNFTYEEALKLVTL